MIDLVNGIVLGSEDLSEFDKRLTLYTRELGKIKANVIGVKKTVSKLRGLTLPFTESLLQIYLHGGKRTGGRDPGKVIGGEALDPHAGLRENWDRLICCTGICEILNVLTHPFYPNPKEYQLISSALKELEISVYPVLTQSRFVLSLLKILGYSLRYHAFWENLLQKEKNLLIRLAKWKAHEFVFSSDEINWIEQNTNRYLNPYLPKPLKTEIFKKKCNRASHFGFSIKNKEFLSPVLREKEAVG